MDVLVLALAHAQEDVPIHVPAHVDTHALGVAPQVVGLVIQHAMEGVRVAAMSHVWGLVLDT